MATIKAHTLSGFMELLPAPQTQMERLMEVLRSSYGVYGFTPLDTPIIEASDVLLAKGGGETEKQIYRFSKGDSDLSLRFDLTVPLAKYVSLHYADLAFPFRRFQIGKVYRGERAQRGRFREFYQADIDVIGDGKLDITNEAEMPAIIYRAFSELGLRRFCIRVNNRKILNGFYAMLGLTDKAGDIMRTVDKLDKIVGNLLSNALKFTPNGGKVELCFDVITREEAARLFTLTDKDIDTQYVKVAVADSGNGIPEEQLEKVFERYYQLDNQSKGTYNWGTGIGLYYARSLALLHHGYLKAGNRTEGSGAVFTLLLPVNDLSYTPEECTLPEEEQNKAFPIQTEEQYQLENTESIRQQKQTLLVVDDDTEVAHYLKALLSPVYKVVCRFDADSAFKAMSEEAPDLVLSDVVMPGRNGYDLCRQIKEDLQLCHIPVILVTAKATVENQVEGLNTGADAYVTKPFEPNYLLALIKSQLKNREKVRSLLSRSTQTDEIEENVLSPQDNTFMTELYHLMENELSNPELDVARMTELLKISRTKFYYKVKGLTGENPSVFFKTYKLNRAAKLIKEGKYTISEIADMTGFSTLSHFSTSFKKQFGATPSEYSK
mgnify:CR=1 FL=1